MRRVVKSMCKFLKYNWGEGKVFFTPSGNVPLFKINKEIEPPNFLII